MRGERIYDSSWGRGAIEQAVDVGVNRWNGSSSLLFSSDMLWSDDSKRGRLFEVVQYLHQRCRRLHRDSNLDRDARQVVNQSDGRGGLGDEHMTMAWTGNDVCVRNSDSPCFSDVFMWMNRSMNTSVASTERFCLRMSDRFNAAQTGTTADTAKQRSGSH
ncbi:hypothetical protein PR003_g26747 [Phytophthora rubi]|uniref:Uncharacterized protein n=1 Tax=Phytophthora rubi TaxID=129364 RepID=A0A6A3I0H9_9STRA|nr:hypothetical protein PR001_g25689 [Phytophthora rubi]KAE9284850.1 hypothetical protein PR003_g26747 [Phytophthora rubi]